MISKMEHIAIMVKNMNETIKFYSEMFGFNVRLRGSRPDREMAFIYLESQPDMEIELIQDINTVVEYNEDGIVNHLAFTVNNIEEEIKELTKKGIIFTSDEIKPTLEGGRNIFFHGPNRELLQLIERAKN